MVVLASGILVIVLLVGAFGFGVFVGQKRAEFSFRWAENYHRNFGGPMHGFFGNFDGMGFTNSHGVFGFVVKVEENSIIMSDQKNVEKTVVTSDKTVIRDIHGLLKLSDVVVGSQVVVIGSPNAQGQIEATFIRVMPAQPSWLMHSGHQAL